MKNVKTTTSITALVASYMDAGLDMGTLRGAVEKAWMQERRARRVAAALGPVDAARRSATAKDRKSTRLNSSHVSESRMPSSA